MSFGGLYARNYDMMYRSKAYEREVSWVAKALSLAKIRSGSLLSLGAGTLGHELILAKRGFSIRAIDRSETMLAIAKKKAKAAGVASKIVLEQADMRSFEVSPAQFDAALSMFNVISYADSLADVKAMMSRVADSLRPGGLFIFDCWNREAFEADQPTSRWRKFEEGSHELIRLTEASYLGKGAVQLGVEVIEFRGGRFTGRAHETHVVRSFALADLTKVATSVGLALRHASVFPEWKKAPNRADWPLGLVFEKATS